MELFTSTIVSLIESGTLVLLQIGKVDKMKLRAEVKPAAWGFAGGAIAAVAVGFMWGGWVTGGTSEARAVDRAATAVVAALTPLCVDSFKHSSDADANLVGLTKVQSWDRHTFIEKGGWATSAGAKEPNQDVARACATTLMAS